MKSDSGWHPSEPPCAPDCVSSDVEAATSPNASPASSRSSTACASDFSATRMCCTQATPDLDGPWSYQVFERLVAQQRTVLRYPRLAESLVLGIEAGGSGEAAVDRRDRDAQRLQIAANELERHELTGNGARRIAAGAIGIVLRIDGAGVGRLPLVHQVGEGVTVERGVVDTNHDVAVRHAARSRTRTER